MARLIYKSYISNNNDKVMATFEGTPEQTLGSALMYFNNESLESAKRRVSGVIPGVPEVILENAKAMLSQSLPERGCQFTVHESEEGFIIWDGEGPDKYILIL